jgi:hypothetical protein
MTRECKLGRFMKMKSTQRLGSPTDDLWLPQPSAPILASMDQLMPKLVHQDTTRTTTLSTCFARQKDQ